MVEKNPIVKRLARKLKGKTVILGIGNTLRGDDAFGSLLAKGIKDKVCFKVLDVGSAPENFLGTIIKEKPDTVLFIDTLDFAAKAGQIKLQDLEKIKTANFFLTHNTSLGLLYNYLKENSKAKFYLLALQPKSIGFGEKLSPEIESALLELRCWFLFYFAKAS